MMGYGTMGWGWILSIVIIAAIVWLVAYAAKKKGPDLSNGEGMAIEILKERFARGEIGREEYDEKRKMLSH
jgi:putative membrane protein